MEPTKPTLDEALKELNLATVNYQLCAEQEREAARKTTDALNRVNRAQKGLDALLADLRGKAPRESDWKQEERRKGEVVVDGRVRVG